jgi:hypothetical protein
MFAFLDWALGRVRALYTFVSALDAADDGGPSGDRRPVRPAPPPLDGACPRGRSRLNFGFVFPSPAAFAAVRRAGLKSSPFVLVGGEIVSFRGASCRRSVAYAVGATDRRPARRCVNPPSRISLSKTEIAAGGPLGGDQRGFERRCVVRRADGLIGWATVRRRSPITAAISRSSTTTINRTTTLRTLSFAAHRCSPRGVAQVALMSFCRETISAR